MTKQELAENQKIDLIKELINTQVEQHKSLESTLKEVRITCTNIIILMMFFYYINYNNQTNNTSLIFISSALVFINLSVWLYLLLPKKLAVGYDPVKTKTFALDEGRSLLSVYSAILERIGIEYRTLAKQINNINYTRLIIIFITIIYLIIQIFLTIIK